MRFALCRYYKAKFGIDIITDGHFAEANSERFRAQCVQNENDGVANVEHKPAISESDMKKTTRMWCFEY